eukprot:6211809-Pleurochrysis_carterae.AAC.3
MSLLRPAHEQTVINSASQGGASQPSLGKGLALHFLRESMVPTQNQTGESWKCQNACIAQYFTKQSVIIVKAILSCVRVVEACFHRLLKNCRGTRANVQEILELYSAQISPAPLPYPSSTLFNSSRACRAHPSYLKLQFRQNLQPLTIVLAL